MSADRECNMSIHQTLTQILVVTTMMTSAPTVVAGDLTVNLGWNSDYIFRGVAQSDSSVFAGLDAEYSGFYLGTWAADVDDGLEVDVYGGYGGEWNDFRYEIGVTAYLYTDDFDDQYFELNISGGYSYVSLDIAIGEYENFSGPTLDYQYYTLAAQYEDFYASFSSWSDDYDGRVFELGYSGATAIKDVELFDYQIAIIRNNDISIQNLLQLTEDDTSFVLTVSKTF